MSDSDRGKRGSNLGADLKFLCAILLTLAVGLGFGYLEGHQTERRQNSTYEYAEEAKRNAVIACAGRGSGAVADCVYDEIDSAKEESESRQDLDAQQWMARWAALLTIFTLATTLISWMALRYLRDTFRETSKGAQAASDATDEMRRANDIAREANRAWLAVEPQLVGFLEETGNEPEIRISVEMTVRNAGGGPACNIHVDPRLVFTKKVLAGDIQRKLSEEARKSPEQAWFPNATLMPNDTHTQTHHIGTSAEALNDIRAFFDTYEHKFDKYPLPLHLVGVVQYRIPGSETLHQTGFSFQIQRRSTPDRGGAIFDSDLPLPMGLLQLMHAFDGPGVID